MITRRRRNVPALNTASLPDLIFTVLFFFMIVTHMRKDAVKVQYQLPAGTELTKLTKKSATAYVYVGKSTSQAPHPVVQLNDKLVRADELADYIVAERRRMSPEDAPRMTVSLKADRQTGMATITEVKQALRTANALRVSYSATNR